VDEIGIRLRRGGGVIDRRSNRDISGRLDRMLRGGTLTAILPAIYCTPDERGSPMVRLRAAALWAGPDAVMTGHAAARLTFWPECPLVTITVALPGQAKQSRPGFVIERRRLPPTDVVERANVRATVPSVTAVDLACTADGGEAIDRALRSRTATLDQMWGVLARHRYRRGNRQRAALLHDSADQPWSEAERLLHRLLRAAGFAKWSTNAWVTTGENRYCVDILFDAAGLVLEVDGWETHGSRSAFEDDRRRRNHLVLAGYRVLNLTWHQLVEDPAWVVECVRTALMR
jgi:very-short-patch-repair endonuclease